jgi:glucan phosphoethanolaminetransferase (alkaline phosphatase superfamily)
MKLLNETESNFKKWLNAVRGFGAMHFLFGVLIIPIVYLQKMMLENFPKDEAFRSLSKTFEHMHELFIKMAPFLVCIGLLYLVCWKLLTLKNIYGKPLIIFVSLISITFIISLLKYQIDNIDMFFPKELINQFPIDKQEFKDFTNTSFMLNLIFFNLFQILLIFRMRNIKTELSK